MRTATLAVAVLLLAGCGGPPAGEPAGQIDGAVLGPLMAPYGNVTVTLEETGATTRTTELGGFSFRGVPPGLYHLSTQVPGTSGDREVVAVQPGNTTRIILQVFPQEQRQPSERVWASVGAADLAVPGATCDGCTWGIRDIDARPQNVTFEVLWSSVLQPDGPGHLATDLMAGGEVVATLVAAGDGQPHAMTVDSSALPPRFEELSLRVRFGSDMMPQPAFRMEMALRLAYL